jgi:hypothetical protein
MVLYLGDFVKKKMCLRHTHDCVILGTEAALRRAAPTALSNYFTA